MTSFGVTSTIYFIFSFVALLVLGLTLRDSGFQPGVFADIDQMLLVIKYNDPGYFALGAKDIYAHGWITEPNRWLKYLGHRDLCCSKVSYSGCLAPTPRCHLYCKTLACLLLAAMCTLERNVLRLLVHPAVASVIPFIIFVFPIARLFLIEPIGVILGETYAVILFMCSTLLVIVSVLRRRNIYAVLAGSCLGLAPYFSVRYESLVLFYLGSGVFVGVWLFLTGRKNQNNTLTEAKKRLLIVICIHVIVSNLFLFPWRIHNRIETGSFAWSQGIEYLRGIRLLILKLS